MSEPGEAVLVCGFGNLGAGLGALAWEVGGGGGILLSAGRAIPADVAITREGDRTRLGLTAGETVVEASLAPRRAPIALGGGGGVAVRSIEAAACTARVGWTGRSGALECAGHLSRWAVDPLEGAGTFRHLGIECGEGSLLIVCARGEPGQEHGEEEVSAWMIDADGHVGDFDEALLSTQYDGGGRPTRAGLELWPGDDAPPTRVAGSLLGGADAGASWGGLLHCHTDGAEGIGSYLLRRS